jgi:hydroxypyruvate isomerase
MLRFSANLSMLFTEVPLLERFRRAAEAGFRAVELQFPYEQPAAALREQLERHGLELVLHNLPAGDWVAGDRGIACDPARVAEFRSGVARAIEYATTLKTPRLNCLAGKQPAGVSEAEARRTLLENLRFAATALHQVGLTLLIEPVNRFDVPGFFVQRSDDAVALIEEVGAPNLKLQYDVYHQQRTEGELAATLQRLLPHIGHIQVADNPGRHEPGTGEIAWRFLFAHLERIGYAGYVGCEYKPAAGTEAGLGWMEALT